MLPGADSGAWQFRAVVRAGFTPCSFLIVSWWETLRMCLLSNPAWDCDVTNSLRLQASPVSLGGAQFSHL